MPTKPEDEMAARDATSDPEIYAIQRTNDGFALARRVFVALPALALGLKCNRHEQVPKNTPHPQLPSGDIRIVGSCTDFRAHSRGVAALTFLGNGKGLVTGGLERSIKVWTISPAGAGLVKVLDGYKEPTSVFSNLDGTLIGATVFPGVSFWSLPAGRHLSTLEDKFPWSGYGVALSGDGNLFAVATGNNYLQLWSLPDGKLLKALDEKSIVPGKSVVIAANASLLASDIDGCHIQLWSLPDGRPLKKLRGSSNSSAQVVALSGDGRLLLSMHHFPANGVLKVWSLPKGALLKTFSWKEAADVPTMSADGGSFAWKVDAHTVEVCSLPNGSPVKRVECMHDTVQCHALSPDGSQLAVGSAEGTIRLWSLPQGTSSGCLFDQNLVDEHKHVVVYRTEERALCTCNTVAAPSGIRLPDKAVCVCNAVAPRSFASGGESRTTAGVCSCNQICTCDSVCRCESFGGCGGGGHYWRPN